MAVFEIESGQSTSTKDKLKSDNQRKVLWDQIWVLVHVVKQVAISKKRRGLLDTLTSGLGYCPIHDPPICHRSKCTCEINTIHKGPHDFSRQHQHPRTGADAAPLSSTQQGLGEAGHRAWPSLYYGCLPAIVNYLTPFNHIDHHHHHQQQQLCSCLFRSITVDHCHHHRRLNSSTMLAGRLGGPLTVCGCEGHWHWFEVKQCSGSLSSFRHMHARQ